MMFDVRWSCQWTNRKVILCNHLYTDALPCIDYGWLVHPCFSGGLQIKAAEILGNEELLQVRGKDMVADEVQYHRSRYKDYTNVVMKQRLTYERSKFLDGKAFAKFFQTVIEDRIMKGEIICLHKLKGMFIGVAREICPHEASNFCSVHFKEKQVVRYPQLQFIRPTGWNV